MHDFSTKIYINYQQTTKVTTNKERFKQPFFQSYKKPFYQLLLLKMERSGPIVLILIMLNMSMYIGPVKQKNMRKIGIIVLTIHLNMCFGCSKEPSHRDGSFEYPQRMFWLRNKKNNFQLHTLIWRTECITLLPMCFIQLTSMQSYIYKQNGKHC